METKLKNYRDIVIKAVELYDIKITELVIIHFNFDKKIISLDYIHKNNKIIINDVLNKENLNYKHDDFEYLLVFKAHKNKDRIVNFDDLYKEVKKFLHHLNNMPSDTNYIRYITFYNDMIYLKFDKITVSEDMEYKKEYLSGFKRDNYHYAFTDYPHLRIVSDDFVTV